MDKQLQHQSPAKMEIITEEKTSLAPIQVSAKLQIVVPTPNEAMMMLYEEAKSFRNEITGILENLLLKSYKSTVPVRYMKTKEMARYLSVSPSFLEKNIDKHFREGIHYYRNGDARLLRWDVDAMQQWMKGGADDNALLSKLLS